MHVEPAQRSCDSLGIQAMSPEEEAAQRAAFEKAAAEAPQLTDYLEHHRPFYEKARALAIGAEA